jgi:hypothetical protein
MHEAKQQIKACMLNVAVMHAHAVHDTSSTRRRDCGTYFQLFVPATTAGASARV